MADFVFNIAKGRVAELVRLPAVGSQIVAVVLSNLGTNLSPSWYDSLAGLIAGGAIEQTTMGRLVCTPVAWAPDNVSGEVDADIADLTWPLATGDPVTSLLICYDPGTGDANIIPMTAHDFGVTPVGADITAQFATLGFYKAT